jgi:hypothetical protein
MAVVNNFDWENRLIYMGVSDFNPIDIYREHRTARANSLEAQKFPPLVSMEGNFPKGGGRRTPRFLLLKLGAKIVPLDGIYSQVTNINGEVLSDDQSSIISTAPLSMNPLVNYFPPTAEVIEVSSGGSAGGLTSAQEATLNAIQSKVDTLENGLTTDQLATLGNIETLVQNGGGGTPSVGGGLTTEQDYFLKGIYYALLGRRTQYNDEGTITIFDDDNEVFQILQAFRNGQESPLPKSDEIKPI